MHRALLMVLLLAPPVFGQQPETISFKGFSHFKEVVPGVDFFAAKRQVISPFEGPVAEVRQRMGGLLGSELPKGAIFVCSTLQQKDSVYEPRAMKMGYSWVLVGLTADARMEETIARLKSQSGGQVPAEMLARFQNVSPEQRAAQDAAMVRTVAQQVPFAILQAVFAPDKMYRSARVEDVGRTGLPDWLDVGLANYATGSLGNLQYLQQHPDDAFSLEDILSMSRPFVAASTGGGARGQGMAAAAPSAGDVQAAGGQRTAAARGTAGQQGTATGGARGGASRVLPKDQQDRLLFDAESASFFAFLLNRVGPAKSKELIDFCRGGQDGRAFLQRPEVLGADLEKIETDWLAWLKTQKSPGPQGPQRVNP